MIELELNEAYRLRNWNLNRTVQVIVVGIICVTYFLLEYIDTQYYKYISLIMIGAFFISLAIRGMSAFSKYEYTIGPKLKLVIDESSIYWDTYQVDWTDIARFFIEYNEVNDNYRFNHGPQNNISDGYNRIEIKTINGTFLKGHYRLMGDWQIDQVKEI